MKKISSKSGRYYYSLGSYSLMRVLSFERFCDYFGEAPSGELVLDYGAGDRPYEGMLRTKYKRYLAADYFATHSSYYNSATPDIVLNDASLQLEDASVDCMILTEVLEHIYDPCRVLAEAKRVLKPGGRLLGTVPFAIQHHDEPYDYHRYTYHCLERMFADAGLQVHKLDYIGDMVAVWTSIGVGILDVAPRVCDKAHLGFVGMGLRKLFQLPLFAYYYALKAGLDPAKMNYFKRYPLGFSFCCIKP